MKEFKLKDGTTFAIDYVRVVVGGMGPYIEFKAEHIVVPLKTQPGQEYRGHGKYQAVKYFWLTPADGPTIKVYHQRGKVNYADYKVGLYYVDPNELQFDGELYAEVGSRPGETSPSTWRKQ